MQVGGPSWTVKLGRRDSTTASKSLANSDLPLFTDDLTTLISHFTNKGLTARDMVTLSGKFITTGSYIFLYWFT
jgi:peroxidase